MAKRAGVTPSSIGCRLLQLMALSLWAGIAVAQTDLGALLDAGAKRMTPDEFRRELVQRVLVGPSAVGGTFELMYGTNDVVSGMGSQLPFSSSASRAAVSGDWRIDDAGRICTSMRLVVEGGGTSASGAIQLAWRCQYWYKLGEAYYVSDSETERDTKVLKHALKQ